MEELRTLTHNWVSCHEATAPGAETILSRGCSNQKFLFTTNFCALLLRISQSKHGIKGSLLSPRLFLRGLVSTFRPGQYPFDSLTLGSFENLAFYFFFQSKTFFKTNKMSLLSSCSLGQHWIASLNQNGLPRVPSFCITHTLWYWLALSLSATRERVEEKVLRPLSTFPVAKRRFVS